MISRLEIGNDVSNLWFDVYYFVNKQPVTARFTNDPEGFKQFIESVEGLARKVHVCMEHTGGYQTKLARACKKAGFIVSLVDGAKIAHFGKSFSLTGVGTDKRSAYLLARFCKERRPEEWFEVPDEYRKLRELTRHRDRLLKSKIEWSCRAAHLVENELVGAQRRCIIEVLTLQVQELQVHIAKHIAAHPNLKEAIRLLDTLPGVAFISAAKILAEVGPIEEYDSARSLALAAGLVPIVIHSGQRTPPGKLPIYGNRELRSALYFPTVVCYGKDRGVGPFMKKVAANGDKVKMTQITAGMRKMIHLVYGILTTGKAYDLTKLQPKK